MCYPNMKGIVLMCTLIVILLPVGVKAQGKFTVNSYLKEKVCVLSKYERDRVDVYLDCDITSSWCKNTR